MPSYNAIIAGTGSYLPEKRLTNAELAKMVDTSDEWIVQRTGIRERRIAAPLELTSHMAAAAAKQALEDAKIPGSEVDLVIVCTVTKSLMIWTLIEVFNSFEPGFRTSKT